MPVYRTLDHNFFKTWSPDMAYVLGFFWADGTLTINPRGGHYFVLESKDKKLLEQIQSSMGSNHKLTKRIHKINKAIAYRVQIGSKKMCQDLMRYGTGTQKTFRLELPRIPKNYFNDFLRGYFDGDGHVWSGLMHKERKTSLYVVQAGFTSCSYGFLESLKEKLQEKGLIGSLVKVNNASAFRLQYSTKSSKMLHNLMYSNSQSLCLRGKKIKFCQKLKMRS